MRRAVKQRFMKFVSYLIVINLSLVPVAHASMSSLSIAPDQMMVEHDCDQSGALKTDHANHPHKNKMTESSEGPCEHGSACKILCSISISMINQENGTTSEFKKVNRWITSETPPVQSTIRFRLERPPKVSIK